MGNVRADPPFHVPEDLLKLRVMNDELVELVETARPDKI